MGTKQARVSVSYGRFRLRLVFCQTKLDVGTHFEKISQQLGKLAKVLFIFLGQLMSKIVAQETFKVYFEMKMLLS